MNKGSIVAREGEVVPIGRSVVNEGRIGAANETATLAAASTVSLTTVGGPAGIYVAPDASADCSVTQSGRIAAAAAALRDFWRRRLHGHARCSASAATRTIP